MTDRPALAPRLVFVAILGVAVAVLALMLTGTSDPRIRVKMVMPDALGLRVGSDVRVGGVSVGRVSHLKFTQDDQVQIDLAIKDEDVRLGNNASVAIKSLNLLGEKYVAMDPGDVSTGTPTRLTIPSTRVSTATDLDQVLDVLDTDTRTRLAILINETGHAMSGRHADFSALLAKLPKTLDSATRLLGDVVADNHSLAAAVTHSDRFLASAVAQKQDLGRFVGSAADAATTFAQRREALKATLRNAPGGLSSLRGLLAKLQSTADPLGEAARNISATAPQLTSTLHAIPAFRTAAKPTLEQATAVAPSLTRLATGAQPTVHRSLATLSALQSFAADAAPVTRLLGTSTPDLLGVLEGWGRAIQGRDSRGHVFHGGVTFGAGALQELLTLPGVPAAKGKRKPAHKPDVPALTPAEIPKQLLPKVTEKTKPIVGDLPKKLEEVTKKLLGIVTDATSGKASDPGADGSSTDALLTYLLKP